MRNASLAVVIPAVAILAVATVAVSASTRAGSGDPKAARVARGEYLTTVMGCGDCHTPGTLYGSPDFSRRFAGSELGWRGPWGVDYAANLTPDPETGIGKWSEQDIVNVLHTGMAPGGRVVQPPMPWPNMTRLTDEDAYSIAAYLKSIPAISHKVPARIPPGQPATGPMLEFPVPPAWDVPHAPPAGGPGGGGGK